MFDELIPNPHYCSKLLSASYRAGVGLAALGSVGVISAGYNAALDGNPTLYKIAAGSAIITATGFGLMALTSTLDKFERRMRKIGQRGVQ